VTTTPQHVHKAVKLYSQGLLSIICLPAGFAV